MYKPDQTENFESFEQNDITLYIGKNARIAAPALHFKIKRTSLARPYK